MKTAKRRLCSLITRSLLRDRCCLLVSQALLLDLNWRGNGHWKGLAKLYLMCVGAEMLTVLWGEAEEGFTAPLQCDCGLAGNFSDHRHSLSSSVTVFGFSRQTICLISRCMPLITPQLICFLPPHPVPLCSPLPAQLPPWTTGTPKLPIPTQTGRSLSNHPKTSHPSHRRKSSATVFAGEFIKGDTKVGGEDEHDLAQIRGVTESL